MPLLHYLIGIGDHVLSKFRDIVSEHMKYIAPEERDILLARGCWETITIGLLGTYGTLST